MTKLQFSLRAMLAVMVVVAICAGLWRIRPSWQCGIFCLPFAILVPASMALLAARATGIAKTFFLAVATVMLMAAVTQVGNVLSAGQMFYDDSTSISVWELLAFIAGQKRGVIVAWAVALLAGVLSAIAHIILDRGRSADE